MAWFQYVGFDQHGGDAKGQVEAESQSDALSKLEQKGLLIASINALEKDKSFRFGLSNKLSLADIELLTSELSILLANGVKIDRGLDIIARSTSKPSLASLLRSLSTELKKGSTLADAMEKHEKIFGSLYINLVRLGELSGTLPLIFQRLASDLKFRQELSQKIAQAVVYPMVILFVCIGSLFFVFNFIVPRMASLFADVPDLPWYTSLLLGLSDWVNTYQIHLLVSVILSFVVLSWAWNQRDYKERIKYRLLLLPVIRNLSLVIERIRFNAGLTMMLEAGISIDKALKLSVGNLNNPHIRREMEIAVKKVSSGGKLSDTLASTSMYPDFFVALLEVGEETATLPSVFDEITKRSRSNFELQTQKMTALLEPALILFMGGIVGSVVVIMLMSMVSVNDIAF